MLVVRPFATVEDRVLGGEIGPTGLLSQVSTFSRFSGTMQRSWPAAATSGGGSSVKAPGRTRSMSKAGIRQS